MNKNQPFRSRVRCALQGLFFSARTERSMRVHLLAVVLVIIALIAFAPSPEWWALVALACAAVITTELINTAIEHLADRLHPEQHPSIGVVKDCAAAAVLVSSMVAIIVAAALAIHVWQSHRAPYFYRWLTQYHDSQSFSETSIREHRLVTQSESGDCRRTPARQTIV